MIIAFAILFAFLKLKKAIFIFYIYLMVKYNPINITKDSNFIFDLREKNIKNSLKKLKT